jgi:hypothetical protein
MRSDSMLPFHVDLLFQMVKRAVDEADLESLGPSAPADEYGFECREITEHLCEGGNATTVDDLTTWLASYWARQFDATATDEWLRSRNFRGLAEELMACRNAVDLPEARVQYAQWLRTSASGYAVTNEELLLLVKHSTVKLAERLYQKWAVGAEANGTETEYQHAGAESSPPFSNRGLWRGTSGDDSKIPRSLFEDRRLRVPCMLPGRSGRCQLRRKGHRNDEGGATGLRVPVRRIGSGPGRADFKLRVG